MRNLVDMPDVTLRVPAELAERLQDWMECAAVRLVRDGDQVTLEVATNLEAITCPCGVCAEEDR